jgi:hypothetical protein
MTKDAAPLGTTAKIALPLIAVFGVALCVWRPAPGPVPEDLTVLFGSTLCVYAAIIALARFPVRWLSWAFNRLFDSVLGQEYSGWYLVVVLARFARAEVMSAIGRRGSEFSTQDAVLGWVQSYVIGFSVTTFMNALWASLWPIREIPTHGFLPTAIFALLVYVLYALGGRTLGEPRLSRAEAEDSAQ